MPLAVSKPLPALRKTRRHTMAARRVTAFGNALGNSIVGALKPKPTGAGLRLPGTESEFSLSDNGGFNFATGEVPDGVLGSESDFDLSGTFADIDADLADIRAREETRAVVDAAASAGGVMNDEQINALTDVVKLNAKANQERTNLVPGEVFGNLPDNLQVLNDPAARRAAITLAYQDLQSAVAPNLQDLSPEIRAQNEANILTGFLNQLEGLGVSQDEIPYGSFVSGGAAATSPAASFGAGEFEFRVQKILNGKIYNVIPGQGTLSGLDAAVYGSLPLNPSDPQTAAYIAARVQDDRQRFLSFASDAIDVASVLAGPLGIVGNVAFRTAGFAVDSLSFYNSGRSQDAGSSLVGLIAGIGLSPVVGERIGDILDPVASVLYNNRSQSAQDQIENLGNDRDDRSGGN